METEPKSGGLGPSIQYWEGKIAADGQDFDAFYKYNIPVVATDDAGEKKVNFQFRPALPDAEHVETGDPIRSMPVTVRGVKETPFSQARSTQIGPVAYIHV